MRILIAEDDPANRRLLEVSLQRWGYEAVVAAEGHTAWQLLQLPDAPQIAILDWMMPGLDGIEICRRVRAAGTRFVYLILLTTKHQKEDVIRALEAGADDFVTKPFDREELQARVHVASRMVELQQAAVLREQELAVARALVLERDRFETAVSAMSDGIIVLDSQWRLVTANRAATLCLKLPEVEGTGLSLDQALLPFCHTPAWAELQASAERVTAIEIARTDTSLPLFLAARLTRLRDTEGGFAGAVLTLRDVTTERHAQNLQRSFFMMVSHKLRTPITVLRGFLQLCRRMPPDQKLAQLDEVLSTCGKEVKLLDELVQKMLEFKVMTAPQLQADTREIALLAALPPAEAEVRQRYPEKELNVTTEVNANASELSMNPDHLVFVIERLLDNAVKFGDKAPVCVAVRAERIDDEWLRLEVADNGPGIPHEYFDRVFEGFVQVEDHITGQIPGLGVGLCMTRRVIEAYDGTITLRSTWGEGSTFAITLPSRPAQCV